MKSNIGHTLTASGVAGVIKVLLALKHRQIPPTLHCDQTNELISFANSPFYVNTRLRDWTATENPRRAAVSSFGFSGTNAHMVLEESQQTSAISNQPQPRVYVAGLSARTPAALRQRIHDLIEWLCGEGRTTDLGDLAYTLNVGRTHFAERVLFVLRNRWRNNLAARTGPRVS